VPCLLPLRQEVAAVRRLFVLAALVFALDARAVAIDWVAVGNPNNSADTPSTNCFAANCGSVPYDYWISKYEVTNAQYAEFLNAKAGSDPLGLYNIDMGNAAINGGINKIPTTRAYRYGAKAGFENKPVTYVSFYDALRFANWLHNGKGSGDTETGAYTLLGGTATPSYGPAVTRNPGAQIFLPSENEWYKAAYFDGAKYFAFPAGFDAETKCALPGATPNAANCDSAVGAVTDVGAYSGSASPYGTFDQGGNVSEWNEQTLGSLGRSIRGGGWLGQAVFLATSVPGYNDPTYENAFLGFRVASLVPEPGTGLLGMTAVLALAATRRRRAN
jgi:formylglycine-generating enzyme required for sulfatase activity